MGPTHEFSTTQKKFQMRSTFIVREVENRYKDVFHVQHLPVFSQLWRQIAEFEGLGIFLLYSFWQHKFKDESTHHGTTEFFAFVCWTGNLHKGKASYFNPRIDWE